MHATHRLHFDPGQPALVTAKDLQTAAVCPTLQQITASPTTGASAYRSAIILNYYQFKIDLHQATSMRQSRNRLRPRATSARRPRSQGARMAPYQALVGSIARLPNDVNGQGQAPARRSTGSSLACPQQQIQVAMVKRAFAGIPSDQAAAVANPETAFKAAGVLLTPPCFSARLKIGFPAL